MTSLPTRTRRRAAAALVAGALAAGLTPAPALAAIPVDQACPPHTPEDGFTDTGLDGTTGEHAVDCLVAHGVSTGRTSTSYRPKDLVTRGQLATFVVNVLDRVEGFTPPAAPPSRFPDVEATDTHGLSIDRVAAIGVVQGYEDGRFRPGLPVSRAQMATFVAETLEAAGVAVPAGVDGFTDDDGNRHEARIDGLKALDVVEGVGLGRYEPGRAVRRDTMALYLTRTLEVLVRAGRIAPFPPPGPTILDARAADGGVVGVVDADDVHQLVLSEPLAATADDVGQRYRLVDGDGTAAEITCGVGASCVLQGPGTYEGVDAAAGQVLRVFLGAPVEALPGAAGTVPGLQYPATLTHASDGMVDRAGRALVLGTHSDAILDAAVLTPPAPTADTQGPNLFMAVASEVDNTVTIHYSEPVVCDPSPAASASFFYSDLDDSEVPAQSVECNGTDQVVVAFDDGVIEAADAMGTQGVRYHDTNPQPDADDVRDLSGNQAMATDQIRAMFM